MSISESLNGGLTITFASLALLTSFLLPAEISVLFLLMSYPSAIYSVGLMAGNRNGRYDASLSFFWKLFVVTIVVFSIIYWRYGLVHQDEETEISLSVAFYFSITTLTTLGYGDFAPPPRIRHLTSLQAILGYVSLGVWIGLINKLIGELDVMRRSIRAHNKDLISNGDRSSDTNTKGKDS